MYNYNPKPEDYQLFGAKSVKQHELHQNLSIFRRNSKIPDLMNHVAFARLSLNGPMVKGWFFHQLVSA